MDELLKMDLYAILEVEEDSTEKEIVKAYRKKALKCHPDKNPDNPKAVEKFLQLSKAVEVLSDKAARVAYDKCLRAKKAAEARTKVFDEKRKKFKQDLDAREAAAAEQREVQLSAKEQLQKEVERLRKEGTLLLEQEKLKEEMNRENEKLDSDNESDQESPKIRVKWKSKKDGCDDYEEIYLKQIFSKYGDISNLLISSKKKGTAIVEFESKTKSLSAVKYEIGKPNNPLKISWLSGEPKQQTTSTGFTNQSSSFTQSELMQDTNRDFESIVLMRMRQAEERKKLIEQMKAEDESEANS